MGTELRAGNQLDAAVLSGANCFSDPIDCIVVGEAEGLHSGSFGLFHRLRWSAQPVGAKRMYVEVGEIKLQ